MWDSGPPAADCRATCVTLAAPAAAVLPAPAVHEQRCDGQTVSLKHVSASLQLRPPLWTSPAPQQA